MKTLALLIAAAIAVTVYAHFSPPPGKDFDAAVKEPILMTNEHGSDQAVAHPAPAVPEMQSNGSGNQSAMLEGAVPGKAVINKVVDNAIDHLLAGGDNKPAKDIAHAMTDGNPLKAVGMAIFSPSTIGPEETVGPGVQLVSGPPKIVEASPANEKATVPIALQVETKTVPAETRARPTEGGAGDRGGGPKAGGDAGFGNSGGDRARDGPVKDAAGI